MTKTISTVLLVAGALAFNGCATSRLGVGGILYAETLTPLDATTNQPGNRVGEACATSIFGLIAKGDASIETARRNGGITLISTVDEKYDNVLGISRYCAIVRGR